ncbi:uncharacterized protein LOC143281346 isoform X2 [Babylonia areolata]|uniref:uncharacterized protein LOC143281346 isoform X2 n=1 Tax=Babylonia areolata TaxID=304850 RepID=UPI003FD58E72
MDPNRLSMGKKRLKFIQVSARDVIQLELHPFLSPSHVCHFDRNWFLPRHMQEVEELLKPVLTNYVTWDNRLLKDKGFHKLSQSCLQGSSVRVGFTLKQKRENQCLLNRSSSDSGYRWRGIQSVKLVAYVCPRLQGSAHTVNSAFGKLLHSGEGADHTDISQYFLPVSSTITTHTTTTTTTTNNTKMRVVSSVPLISQCSCGAASTQASADSARTDVTHGAGHCHGADCVRTDVTHGAGHRHGAGCVRTDVTHGAGHRHGAGCVRTDVTHGAGHRHGAGCVRTDATHGADCVRTDVTHGAGHRHGADCVRTDVTHGAGHRHGAGCVRTDVTHGADCVRTDVTHGADCVKTDVTHGAGHRHGADCVRTDVTHGAGHHHILKKREERHQQLLKTLRPKARERREFSGEETAVTTAAITGAKRSDGQDRLVDRVELQVKKSELLETPLSPELDPPGKQRTLESIEIPSSPELDPPDKQKTLDLESFETPALPELDPPDKQRTLESLETPASPELDSPDKQRTLDLESLETPASPELDSPDKQRTLESLETPSSPELESLDRQTRVALKPRNKWKTSELGSGDRQKLDDRELSTWGGRERLTSPMESIPGTGDLQDQELPDLTDPEIKVLTCVGAQGHTQKMSLFRSKESHSSPLSRNTTVSKQNAQSANSSEVTVCNNTSKSQCDPKTKASISNLSPSSRCIQLEHSKQLPKPVIQVVDIDLGFSSPESPSKKNYSPSSKSGVKRAASSLQTDSDHGPLSTDGKAVTDGGKSSQSGKMSENQCSKDSQHSLYHDRSKRRKYASPDEKTAPKTRTEIGTSKGLKKATKRGLCSLSSHRPSAFSLHRPLFQTPKSTCGGSVPKQKCPPLSCEDAGTLTQHQCPHSCQPSFTQSTDPSLHQQPTHTPGPEVRKRSTHKSPSSPVSGSPDHPPSNTGHPRHTLAGWSSSGTSTDSRKRRGRHSSGTSTDSRKRRGRHSSGTSTGSAGTAQKARDKGRSKWTARKRGHSSNRSRWLSPSASLQDKPCGQSSSKLVCDSSDTLPVIHYSRPSASSSSHEALFSVIDLHFRGHQSGCKPKMPCYEKTSVGYLGSSKASVTQPGNASTPKTAGVQSASPSSPKIGDTQPGSPCIPSASGTQPGPSTPKRSGPSTLKRSGPSSPKRSGPSSPKRSGPSTPKRSGPSGPSTPKRSGPSGPTSPKRSGPSSPKRSGPSSPKRSGPSGPSCPKRSGPSTPKRSGPSSPKRSGPSTPKRSGPSSPKRPGPSTPKRPGPSTPNRPGPSTPSTLKRPGPSTPKRSGPSSPKRSGTAVHSLHGSKWDGMLCQKWAQKEWSDSCSDDWLPPLDVPYVYGSDGRHQSVGSKARENPDHTPTVACPQKQSDDSSVSTEGEVCPSAQSAALDSSNKGPCAGQSGGQLGRVAAGKRHVPSSSENSPQHTAKRCRHSSGERSPLTSLTESNEARELQDPASSSGCLASLSDQQVRKLVESFKPDLIAISRGTLHCHRHQLYQQGGHTRRNLDFTSNLRFFASGQEDAVMDVLMTLFNHLQLKDVDYLLRVLLPEALARIYKQVTGHSLP